MPKTSLTPKTSLKTSPSSARLPAETRARYAARETRILAAVEAGSVDARAGRVTPHEGVAQRAGAISSPPRTNPAERAVVWTDTGRDDFFESMRRLRDLDPQAAPLIATWIAGTAERLGERATGAPSRLPFTYEKAVPGLAYSLVFEIVTWTKAGEVIAILHLIDEADDRAAEAPI